MEVLIFVELPHLKFLTKYGHDAGGSPFEDDFGFVAIETRGYPAPKGGIGTPYDENWIKPSRTFQAVNIRSWFSPSKKLILECSFYLKGKNSEEYPYPGVTQTVFFHIRSKVPYYKPPLCQ